MNSFGARMAMDAVERLCRGINASDWSGIVEKPSRYMGWEFEDYQEKV